MRGKVGLAGFVLAFACACAPIAREPPETSVARVADGVYAVRLENRVAADEALEPARVSFIVGPGGVAVIDTGLTYGDGLAVLRAIERTTRAPVRIVILTHPAQEAIFGAAAFQERGAVIAMQPQAATLMATRCDACLERLRAALGAAALEGTRVVIPDRMLRDGEVLEDIGRPLTVVAPGWTSAPGAVGVFDAATSTLVAGSLVSIASVPDLRDADVERWRPALERLAAMRCAHLVPAHGRIGACADIEPQAHYLGELEARVRELFARGVELADVGGASELPQYASWERYPALHRTNATRIYLRLEREALEKR